jgi:DNA invertase Pin-like site-specific DNA recombinase
VSYARASTDDHNLALQNDALKKSGCEKFFSDVISGSKSTRPGLDYLLDYCRKGDVVVVWRLDRLGRSLGDLIEIVGALDKKGVA